MHELLLFSKNEMHIDARKSKVKKFMSKGERGRSEMK